MKRHLFGLSVCTATALCVTGIAAAGQTVQLFTSADLERLRSTNPNHYQRAEKLMAAANKYCPVEEQPEAQRADLRSSQTNCGYLDMTSNPPKRYITFDLDGTHYIARITLTASPANPVPAGQ